MSGGQRQRSGPVIDIPWLLLAVVVVAVPLAAAAMAGLATRSRLALAARVE